ncbi:MAG: tripartite tricarboxylate transporter substrate-binding protein [Pseudomonadota bacterium]
MKTLLTAAVAAIGLAASTVSASAMDWTPPGPIKLMIAFAAGGGADTQARLVAEELEAKLGWQFIPEQVTGRGGVNLLSAMKDEPNDGTVIGMIVAESLGYNLYTADTGMTPSDFTPITTVAGAQMGIVSLSSKGWNTIDDMIAAAKAGEDIRFGTMSARLSDIAYLLGQAQGIDLNIVQVRGGRAVMNGVNAGDMDVGFMAGIQASGVASGDLVNLASAMTEPLKQTPDAPLISDYGVAYDANAIFMFAGPAGMPQDARTAIASAIAEAASDETTKIGALIQRAFGGPLVIQGEALEDFVQGDFDDAAELLKAVSQ